MSTSVASERPTIWKRSRSRGASLDQKRARCRRGGAAAGLAVFGRLPREVERAREVGRVERREHERDREGARLDAEQRLVQVGVERGELRVGRLLGQLRVRPETLEWSVLWRIRSHACVVLA